MTAAPACKDRKTAPTRISLEGNKKLAFDKRGNKLFKKKERLAAAYLQYMLERVTWYIGLSSDSIVFLRAIRSNQKRITPIALF